jgi:tetratricopeptide (TPR) repeat protein
MCVNEAGALPAAAAPLLPIGSYRGPRVSSNERSQRLFDQGLVFGWGFNFAEAVRSFRAATLADVNCAMCRWGIAWALGPSINHDMAPADLPVARDAIEQARAYAPDKTSRERRLVDALALRYRDALKLDDQRRARDYAAAMRRLARALPADADIAVLAAEAMMNAQPYDYWSAGGSAPRAWTGEIAALLERALRIAPDHPGAHHYKIHLYEDSAHPDRALASAEKLGALAPSVGHLVHMPSHIYVRVGRYHDAVLANRAAVAADRDYLAAVRANPRYAAGYVAHNIHHLWAAALMSGETSTARTAADELATAARARVDDDPGTQGTLQHFAAAPWLTDVRFRRGDQILARSARAGDDEPYLAGLEHFARGMAFVGKGEVGPAQKEADALLESERGARQRGLKIKNSNSAAALLAVARRQLAAEIALARGDALAAARHARAAVTAEDSLVPDEPPAWQVPARHVLGRALLARGQAREARDVYRADLARHPENAVALAGLAVAERQLGNAARAAALDARSQAAWQHADVALAEFQPSVRPRR